MTNQFADASKMVLSPAAQAIMGAATNGNFNVVNDPVYKQCIAAALRAAADQVVPIKEEPAEPPGYGIGYEPAEYLQDWTRWHICCQLLAIAAELEA
jgi:hypothetical protein